MRVLCDVHIPYRLVSWLRERGVDATHMNRVLDGSETPDSAIATFVDANDMLLITKDSDFRHTHILSQKPARVLLIALGNLSNSDLIALVETHWSIISEVYGQKQCFIELTRDGILRFPLDGARD